HRAEGVSPVAGMLPMLLQAPVFLLLYRLFYAPRIAGHANALLGQALFGVPLGAHFPTGATLFGAVFVALALLAWCTSRWAVRVGEAAGRPAGWLIRLAPYGSVLAVAVVPLAGAV